MGKGVEVRDRSIRLTFTYEGRQRRTLMLNGEPLTPTSANIKHAHRLRAEIGDRIRHGTFSMAEYFPASGSGSPRSVADQLDGWLKAQRIEASTKAGYESAVRFWKATIGPVTLRALKASDCLTAVASRPLLSGKTVNNYVVVLRQALELGVIDGLIPDNPAKHIPRAKHQKAPVDPFTEEETERILADMASHYPEQVLNYTEVKFFTGMRTGESFGLRWQSVTADTMLVTQSIVRAVEKATTKTNASRLVILNSRAAAALRRQKAHTFLAGEHVFHDPRYGRRWQDERAYRRSYWAPTLKRLGIRYRVPYNTRHSYATRLLMSGMAPAFCAGQMGHSVEVFLTTYAKWIPGAGDASEMGKLEARLSLKCPQESSK